MNSPKYKDFPQYDSRRYLVVLFAIEKLADKASLHHIAKELLCTRAEVKRAIESAEKTFHMSITKDGPIYSIESWGILDRHLALILIEGG